MHLRAMISIMCCCFVVVVFFFIEEGISGMERGNIMGFAMEGWVE